MQSNDARMLLRCAVPTAAAGVVAAVAGGVHAGGKGLLGAVFGVVLVVLFMGTGFAVLQYVARNFPHLFQAMGLMLYTTQILLLAIVLGLFKNTTLFDTKVFAFSLLGATLVWIAAQARAHLKAKIMYVEPESSSEGKPTAQGSKS